VVLYAGCALPQQTVRKLGGLIRGPELRPSFRGLRSTGARKISKIGLPREVLRLTREFSHGLLDVSPAVLSVIGLELKAPRSTAAIEDAFTLRKLLALRRPAPLASKGIRCGVPRFIRLPNSVEFQTLSN
jgi:hypothetical protein